MLKTWHEGMFRDVVPVRYYAGNFRQEDPNRLCLGINVQVGATPGAHFRQVVPLMSRLEGELKQRLALVEVSWGTRAAQENLKQVAMIVGVAVGRFIQIHPFVNGNGRTSRLLWAALLARMGLSVEMAIVRRPAAPYDAVMTAAMAGDFAPAVALVFSGLAGKLAPRDLPS